MPEQIHILLIEDDGDDREFLEVALQDNDISYHLNTINRGDLALQWIMNTTSAPHLVIMDLNLPKVHGRDLLLQIRKNKHLFHTPVLVLTTSASPDDKSFCLQNGANAFVSKPSDTEGFKALVISILKLAMPVNNTQKNQP